MENFSEILVEFENLDEIIKIKDEFQPGRDVYSIKSFFNSIDLVPSNEMVELYKWRNGMRNYFEGPIIDLFGNEINTYDGINIFPMSTYLPLEVCHKYYASYSNEYKELFPFFSSDSVLLVNLDNLSKNYNKVYIENAELLIIEPMPIFNSVYDMFFTILEGFKQKVFYFEMDDDDEWCLKRDHERYWDLGKKYNPDCEYWQIGNNEILLNYKYDKYN